MTILISSDGKVKGSKTEPPGKPIIDEWSTEKNILDNYEISISLWKESCLEFEDQERVMNCITSFNPQITWKNQEKRKHDPNAQWLDCVGNEIRISHDKEYRTAPDFKPNTILEVELPPTIDVWQYQSTEGLWLDDHSESYKEGNYTIKYRKILRMV